VCHGQVVKLVNNLVTHALAVVLGPALALGVKAGCPLETLWLALGEGTAQNRLVDEMLPESLFRGDFRPGLTLALALKDLRLASELARELGVPFRLFAAVLEAYERAAAEGFGELSAHAVIRCAERDAGVELRSALFERLGAPGERPEPGP
jgi:3-hydroxyisobutyrate dehydrogenase